MTERKTKEASSEPGNEVVHAASLVERPKKDYVTKKREQTEKLMSIQDELFQKSMTVVNETIAFRDVNPKHAEDPASDPQYREWEAKYGVEEAVKMYRVALAGWMSAKDAPVGAKVATSMVIGIIKARATEKGGNRTLNIGKISLSAPLPEFPEKEIE